MYYVELIHFLVDSGSGRVTFCSHKSYMKAVNAAFVEIKTPKFVKKVLNLAHFGGDSVMIQTCVSI